jgi:hypothetical protein
MDMVLHTHSGIGIPWQIIKPQYLAKPLEVGVDMRVYFHFLITLQSSIANLTAWDEVKKGKGQQRIPALWEKMVKIRSDDFFVPVVYHRDRIIPVTIRTSVEV